MGERQERHGKAPFILLVGMFLIWGFTALLVWYVYHSSYVSHVSLVTSDGVVIAPSEESKIVVPYPSLAQLGEVLGFSVYFEDKTSSVFVSKLDTPVEVEADISLRPLTYDPSYYIRERDLYGEWIGTAENGQVFGFSFMATEEYGPYTVLEVWGVKIDENGDTHDVSRMGFYEILDDNRVRMMYKSRLVQESQEVEEILELDFWDVSSNQAFITLTREGVSVRMSRIETDN